MSQTQQETGLDPGPSRSGDWDRLEMELRLWREKLDELRRQSDRVGQSAITELEGRYETLKSEAEKLRQSTDAEIAKARSELDRASEEAGRQSQSAVDAARSNVKESAQTAREMTHNATARTQEAAKQAAESAQHIGSGFARAWDELRKGFQRAYKQEN